MNPTHIHLLITHLPIFGSILGGIVIAHGLWTKSNPTKIAAYNILIISSIGAVIAYLTGEGAEETVEKVQGVAKNMIDRHEDFAVISFVGLIVLGLSSGVGLFFTLKQAPMTRSIAWIVFFISIISFGLVSRTGYLGGQIRHTEISTQTPSVIQEGTEYEDDE